MSFISSLGEWLRKVSKSFMNATISGKTITLTRHNGDTITLTTQDTTYEEADQNTSGLMSATDKSKLDGITAGAEVNQNAFSTIKVGSNTVTADTKTDTLELVAGSNVTLTLDTVNDKVIIGATDTTYNKATQSADGLMSKEDKTKLDNTATAWTDLGAKLMTATVLRNVLFNIVGVADKHYADGHIHDLNYQTAMFTIFNGWDDTHRANYPTGAENKFSVSLLAPLNGDLQNNTPFYEVGCCQILLSEYGDVWARKKENGSWTSWSYKNSIFPIDGTLTKKIDIGVGTSYSKAFRVGSMGFVIIDDFFPSINTQDVYYQIYDTNLKAEKVTTAPVYDFSGRIIGYAWVNGNGVVFVRGLYTGAHTGAVYTCIQYPVSV